MSTTTELRTRFAVALSAFLAALVPLLLYLHKYPSLAPFSMFANDTFYYLDVARNSQGMKIYTFDGINPTNGFHPVWEFLLYSGMKFRFLPLSHPTQALIRLFYANLVILSTATAALAFFSTRYLDRKWLALLTVCPGWTWFLAAVSAPDYLSQWSYLNGMETSVELLFFSLALLSYSPSRRISWMPVTCFFLGMTVLSRLDDVFFLLPLLAFIFLTAKRSHRRMAFVSCSLPIVMIGAYLAYNVYSVHMALPISGASKAGMAILGNAKSVLILFLPIHWDLPRNQSMLGYSMHAETFMRVLQMIFPMVCCASYLYFRRGEQRGLIDALCLGVILKGAYNFLFVSLFNQGSWYYGASVFVGNLIVSIGVAYCIGLIAQGGKFPARWKCAEFPTIALVVAFSFNAFVNDKLSNGSGYESEHIFEGGGRLASMVTSRGGQGFIEFDDGLLGFSTGLKSISGLGLVLDASAMQARKSGHFFDIAVARGDSFVMSDGAYAEALESFANQKRIDPKRDLWGIHGSEFMEYALVPVARDSATGVRIYRLERRSL